jgi:hypothetical protein
LVGGRSPAPVKKRSARGKKALGGFAEPEPIDGLPKLGELISGALGRVPGAYDADRSIMEPQWSREIERAIKAVAKDTEALPALNENMSNVAQTTKVLPQMDERMASIEEAMPVLWKSNGRLHDYRTPWRS